MLAVLMSLSTALATHTNTTTAPMRPADAPPRDSAHQNSPRARLGRVGPATRRCGARVLLVRACTLVTSVSSRAVSSRAVSSRAVALARPSGGPARWVCPSLRFAVLAVAPPSCSPPARCDSSSARRRVRALLAYHGLVPRPRAKVDVTDPAPAAGMVSALRLTLSRRRNVVQLKHCQCCCDNSWTIVPYRLTIQ